MDPVSIIDVATNSGVSVLLAVLLIYWYRGDTQKRIEESKEREKEAKQIVEREREDKMMLINVLQQNIEVQAKLVAAIQELRGEFHRFSGKKGAPA